MKALKTMRRISLITALVSISILILYFIFSYVVPLIQFIHIGIWGDIIKDFDNYDEDFSKVAEYCVDVFDEKKQENSLKCFLISNSGEEGLFCYYDGISETLPLSLEVQQSLKNVAGAFKHKDAKLYVIECYENSIFFCTHNGTYSVVYSFDNKKPVSLDSPQKQEESVFVRKIKDHWYHVVKNPF